MTATTIAFFNNKGGVGKTSLVYHLSWMYADLGARVVAADLDPQANLTAAFVDEDDLELLWESEEEPGTVFEAIKPLLRGIGDVATPRLRPVSDKLALLVGDLSLSAFEDELSDQWWKCLGGEERSFRVMSAFWRIMQGAAVRFDAEIVVIDLGPNLGAINRAALISADYIVVPLSPDLFSLQGLRNLGPVLKRWREGWVERLGKNPVSDLDLPPGGMQPIGYIVQQHSVRLDRPVRAYDKWMSRIPRSYSEYVIGKKVADSVNIENDQSCLALVKHYRSLMAMAQEARKPIFYLKSADGAIGGHSKAVLDAYSDFEKLAKEIAKRASVTVALA